MDADTHVTLFSWTCRRMVGTELRQDLLGTLHVMYYRGEIHQERIAHGLDDLAMMLSHRLVDDLVMSFQQPQHAGFVAAHLTAKADDVREHDCRQPPSFSLPRTGTVLCHGGDYRARSLRLSNRELGVNKTG